MKTQLTFWAILCLISTVTAQPITFEQHTISAVAESVVSVLPVDVDEDGDQDIFALASYEPYFSLWKNDGNGNFTEWIIGGNHLETKADGMWAGDLDNDGDIDVVTLKKAADQIVWWENDGEEHFTEHNIFDDTDNTAPWSVTGADLDNDQDIDLLVTENFSFDVVLYTNQGQGNFSRQIIENDLYSCNGAAIADIDGDGWQDFAAVGFHPQSPDAGLFWWKNLGNNNFEKIEICPYCSYYYVQLADLDQDGDMDVLASGKSMEWYENDGDENFTVHSIVPSGQHLLMENLRCTDLDQDGHLDIIFTAKLEDDLKWLHNDGSQNFAAYTLSDNYDAAAQAYPADFNGDGRLDIASAALAQDDISWWENQVNTTASSSLPNTGIQAFPNPASQVLHLKISGLQAKQIWFTDVFGRNIPVPVNGHSVDVSHLPIGNYILQIQTDQEPFTQRIMIVR